MQTMKREQNALRKIQMRVETLSRLVLENYSKGQNLMGEREEKAFKSINYFK